MDRNKLLQRIAEETRSATLAYYAYMHTDREYVAGQKLYLREMHFLLIIGKYENISMKEIANHLEVSQGAATQIAARLLKKGLIIKTKCSADKRYTAIALTTQGIQVYEEYLHFDKVRRDEVNAYLADFSESDLNAILKYEILIKEMCVAFLNRQLL